MTSDQLVKEIQDRLKMAISLALAGGQFLAARDFTDALVIVTNWNGIL